MQNYGLFKASFKNLYNVLNSSLKETISKLSAKYANIVVLILLAEATKFRMKPIKELSINHIFPSLSFPGQMLQKKDTPLYILNVFWMKLAMVTITCS